MIREVLLLSFSPLHSLQREFLSSVDEDRGKFQCAGLRPQVSLLAHWQSLEKICNSFHYEARTETCQLASHTFLEDPSPGETALAVMVDTEAAERLEVKCRGGESCCVRNEVRMCGEGEGDCQQDSNCEEGLVCGRNICNQTVSLTDSQTLTTVLSPQFSYWRGGL